MAVVANNAIYEGAVFRIFDGEDYLALMISDSFLVPGPDLQLGSIVASDLSNPPWSPLSIFEAPRDFLESGDDAWSVAIKRGNVAPPR